ncbi:MAG: hypothetical protein EXR71_14920 [Myxococcales bacterium]|nr:hypothetical protein [Myxococcales bacterium]
MTRRRWRLPPWDDVRAALLLVVVVVHGFAAAPLARSASRRRYDLPLARDELTRVATLAGRVGIDTSADQLADTAYAVVKTQSGLRSAVLAPFADVLELTGTGQAWGLFTHPDRFPARLVVEGRPAAGEWRRLYASLDPDATFNLDKFVYRRIRGVYDGNSDKAGRAWDPFVSWVAMEVFAAYPAIDEVRVKFRGIHTFEPGEAAETHVESGERAVRVRRRP